MRPDGTGDRRLARRNDGTIVAWTPDGREIVFDESEVHDLFAVHSDLRAVEVATGRVRAITRGLRAREPDVSPDGMRVVFVRQMGDRSELATVALDGTRPHAGDRLRAGHAVVGPELEPGRGRHRGVADAPQRTGWTSSLVDPDSGAIRLLTDDRAQDVEPAWTPDGGHVVFRSDRDGVSNLYAVRRGDGALLRLTNVLGGAFAPDVSPDGGSVAFSDYRSAGYDVHVIALDLSSAAPAGPFVDPYPAPAPPPAERRDRIAATGRGRRCARGSGRPIFESGNEVKLGVATGGADPLFRHAYGGRGVRRLRHPAPRRARASTSTTAGVRPCS